MRDHLMLIRIRSDATFMPAREQLRSAIASGVEAWGGDFTLVSLSPIPASRYIKKRRSPTKRDRLPQLPFGD
jgi:hypothetical protein